MSEHERSRVAPSPPTVSVPNADSFVVGYAMAIAALRGWASGFYSEDTRLTLRAAANDLETLRDHIIAQAIEAQRAETAKTGSVEDESAVAASDVPKGCGPKEVA